ncbi:MAG: hypothetical protein KC621_04460 [Myxococcales bacterium]|nr:hypothetical protein [Myxococcales bacterium]
MRSWMLALALVLASCIEDGSKELGESCWTREDCADDPAGMVCDALVCGWPDRTRELGESCVEDYDCKTEQCDQAECVPNTHNDGGGGDGGGTIICNDGTRSPTCTSCSSGCCSGHGGCL